MKNRTKQNARLGFGWVPDLPDNRDHLYAAPMAKLGPLPRKVDLRKHCPPVYNQGQIGSCTANAIAAAIEFDRKKQKLADFVPSRLFIYYNERSMEHSVPIDNGAQIRDGIKSVGKQGACPEREWSYDHTPAESAEVGKTGVLNMPAPKEGVAGGHAVLAVGYDDKAQRFTVRNSWGASWGKRGYFTMPYSYLLTENLSDDFWTIRLVH